MPSEKIRIDKSTQSLQKGKEIVFVDDEKFLDTLCLYVIQELVNRKTISDTTKKFPAKWPNIAEVLKHISITPKLKALKADADNVMFQYVEDEFFESIKNIKTDDKQLVFTFHKIMSLISKMRTDKTFIVNYNAQFDPELLSKTFEIEIGKDGTAIPPEGYEYDLESGYNGTIKKSG